MLAVFNSEYSVGRQSLWVDQHSDQMKTPGPVSSCALNIS